MSFIAKLLAQNILLTITVLVATIAEFGPQVVSNILDLNQESFKNLRMGSLYTYAFLSSSIRWRYYGISTPAK